MPGSENSISDFLYVYVLESLKTGGLYIGYSANLDKRLHEHNKGLTFSTKPYRPWHLIFYKAYLNQDDVKRRERYLKTSQGSRLLKRMLKEYLYLTKQHNNI